VAQHDCFISYKSEDRRYAELVHERLKAAGFEHVWFDREELRPGARWANELETHSDASRVILPILTPRWSSEWTRFETYGAEEVIPLRFEGAFMDVTPEPLRQFQALEINFADGAAESEWQKLFDALRALLARPAPDKQARTAYLRYQPHPHFVGRERELLAIHEHFHPDPTTRARQSAPFAITALGGVGKTTLARQYADKFWRSYRQMLWVDARNGIEAEFAALYQKLHPGVQEDLTDSQRAQRLKGELEGGETRLLIIDNVEDEQAVQRWLPGKGGCRTLITSRFAGWSRAVRSLHMYVLEPRAARDLLLSGAELTRPSGDDIEACDELAGKLGYLPLALEQAAAYVREEKRGFRQYLHIYEQATAELLREGVLGSTEYPDSVIATWKPTLARLPVDARALLSIASFMAPTPIPDDYIVAGARFLRDAISALAALEGTSVNLAQNDELLVSSALRRLWSYSMVRRGGGYFDVHLLLQAVQKDALTPQAFAFWALTAASFYEVIKGVQTADPENWAMMRSIYQHLVVSSQNAMKARAGLAGQGDARGSAPSPIKVDPQLLTDRVVWIISQVAHFDAAIGNFETAEQLLRPALAMDAQLPPDPRRRIRPVRWLADLLDGTERSAEAEPLLREQLGLYEAIAGPDDPEVASGLMSLAQFLARQLRWEEAEQLLKRADRLLEPQTDARLVELRFQVLATLTGVYDDSDRPEEAQRARELATALRARVPDDVRLSGVVSRSLLNESHRLAREGKNAEAEKLIDRFVADNEAALGADSDDMALALSQAGDYYQWAERFEKAIEVKRRGLAIEESSYGAEHTMTARALEDLAEPLEQNGRLDEALAARQRALAIEERAYPNGHATIAANLRAIGTLFEKLGQLGPAEGAMRRALSVTEKIRGLEHLEVAECLVALMRILVAADHAESAQPLLERVRSIHERHLGPKSTQFTDILRAHAQSLFRAGRSDLVRAILRDRLALLERVHGPDHEEVLLALRDLVNLLVAVPPVPPDTESLCRRAIELSAKVRGAGDPFTGDLQSTLGILLSEAGRGMEAELLLHSAVSSLRRGGEDSRDRLSVALRHLAELCIVTNRVSAGESLLREALTARDGIADPIDYERAIMLMRLGQTLATLERPAEGEPFAEKALRIFLEAARDRPVSPPLVGNAFLGWGACLHRQAIGGEEIQRRRVALFAEYGVEALWPEIEAGILAEVQENSGKESR
jgi:tetratricopeptide (TPR) repeat protein